MYKLNVIDYPYNALEPILSENTIFIHHTKHHQKYLDNLNKLLNDNNYNYQYTKEQLVSRIDIFPLKDRGSILFNLGGVLNHNIYFLGINSRNREKPSGKLKDYIDKKYPIFKNIDISDINVDNVWDWLEEQKEIYGNEFIMISLV